MTTATLKINESDHTAGLSAAQLELIEYGDYECPYCGRAYPMVKNMQRRFGDDLRFVFRNFPWTKLHPHAFEAAVATEAAALQNKFWEMHDIVFENQEILNERNILQFAKAIELDVEEFKRDIRRPGLAEKVRQDIESGVRLGVNRTPTFFLNGVRYEGHLHEEQLLQFLEEQLAIISGV